MIKEIIYETSLTKQFFTGNEKFMEEVQAFGKKNGMPDGAVVKMEFTHSKWNVCVKLTWDDAEAVKVLL